MLDTPVQNLNITTLTSNALRRAGCRTVGDLLELGSNRAKAIHLIGTAGWLDISRALAGLGLRWTAEGEPQGQHLSPEARQLVAAVDPASSRRTVANILEVIDKNFLHLDLKQVINELRGTR
jgi:Bacterial RNA polymerase, alpha chain C terminal domain